MGKALLAKARKAKMASRHCTLRTVLVSNLKASSGRNDLIFHNASNVASKAQLGIPIQDRAGYPVNMKAGSIDPKDWRTFRGDKIEVDFSRVTWLPDEWGQGVKATERNHRSSPGGRGGTLTCYMAPNGRCFFHKSSVAEYLGRVPTVKDGFSGQVRLAKCRAEQAIKLARAQLKSGTRVLVGGASDEPFFKLLSPQERKVLPSKDEFHFCVVSARRATKVEGVRDIVNVQTQLAAAGATPTWYVDKESLDAYQALGLKAVVGGKLTEARNKCLADANKKGLACVQISDDISAWEYRHGKKAVDRSDDSVNAAFNAARRYVISPVAAARFILAKVRAAEEPRPKLGGLYMLKSCARTMAGDAFSRQHFILGDFFVVDLGSKVTFDVNMGLKEDYDFTCAHIQAHGSVMRCNRMTLNVKHYSNSGGACSNRDAMGKEEKRNIAILHRKWPGCFLPNAKRPNEVLLRWKSPQAVGASLAHVVEDGEVGKMNRVRPKVAAKVRKVASSKAQRSAMRPVRGKRKIVHGPNEKHKALRSDMSPCRDVGTVAPAGDSMLGEESTVAGSYEGKVPRVFLVRFTRLKAIGYASTV